MQDLKGINLSTNNYNLICDLMSVFVFFYFLAHNETKLENIKIGEESAKSENMTGTNSAGSRSQINKNARVIWNILP